ncbi:MAG: hypothetical protein JWM80_2436 [Cyanobacteria bacterium RYN_339]|nr:hypothetical protein [Cyanobacteria bacterium RYN_339]
MRNACKLLLLGLVLTAQGCDLKNLITISLPAGLVAAPRASSAPLALAGSPKPGVSAPPTARPAVPPPTCQEMVTRFDIDRSGGWDLKEYLAYQAAHPAPCAPAASSPATPRPTPTFGLDQALPQVPDVRNANPAFPIGAPAPCNQPDPQAVFRLMDTNQDGQLDPAEACALLEGAPVAPAPQPSPSDGDGGLIWHAPTGPTGPRFPGPIAID